MSNDVLVIAGRDRSGKSALSNYLKDNYDYQIIELGQFARKEFHNDSFKVETTISDYYQSNMKKINNIALNFLEQIARNNSKMCIVGVRTLDLYKSIKQKTDNCRLVYIVSNQDIRFERHLKIQSERLDEGINTKQNFIRNDEIQTSWGIELLKEISDYIIENNQTENNFFNTSIKTLQLI